jgi:hypothetical protein
MLEAAAKILAVEAGTSIQTGQPGVNVIKLFSFITDDEA